MLSIAATKADITATIASGIGILVTGTTTGTILMTDVRMTGTTRTIQTMTIARMMAEEETD
jgi:hypothetical protein